MRMGNQTMQTQGFPAIFMHDSAIHRRADDRGTETRRCDDQRTSQSSRVHAAREHQRGGDFYSLRWLVGGNHRRWIATRVQVRRSVVRLPDMRNAVPFDQRGKGSQNLLEALHARVAATEQPVLSRQGGDEAFGKESSAQPVCGDGVSGLRRQGRRRCDHPSPPHQSRCVRQ